MTVKTAGLSLLVSALFIGCGGSGNDNKTDLDATVAFKSAGTYDLKEYLTPSVNSINIYDEQTFTNKDGKKRFNDDPEKSTYTEKYDINASGVTVYDGQDNVEERYIIRQDRILSLDENGDPQREISRYADVGDYVLSTTVTDSDGPAPVTHKMVCRVTNHLSDKMVGNVTYNDVLEVSCIGKGAGKSEGSNLSIVIEDESTNTNFFAKDIGMISSESISCDQVETVLNGESTKQGTCTKEVDTLIGHNTL